METETVEETVKEKIAVFLTTIDNPFSPLTQIGRASCRERV